MGKDSNIDDVIAAFNSFEDDLKKQVLKRGTARAAGTVYNRAMDNVNGPRTAAANSYPVPVRTADLRNGMRVILPGNAKSLPGCPNGVAGDISAAVVNDSAHAELIHDGHPETIIIRPKRAKALKFKVIGSIQTHYKRGAKKGQALASPKIKFDILFRKKVEIPPAGPRPYLENARNDSAEEASNCLAEEVIAEVEARQSKP